MEKVIIEFGASPAFNAYTMQLIKKNWFLHLCVASTFAFLFGIAVIDETGAENLRSFQFLGIGIALLLWSGVDYYKMRSIFNLSTSKIRSLAVGLVEIQGNPVTIRGMYAPFSGHSVVYSIFTIEKRYGNSEWRTIDEGHIGDTFFLKDKTGRVLVDPTGAKCDLYKTYVENTGAGEKPTSTTRRFLEEQNIEYKSKQLLGFKWQYHKMRFTEYSMYPGNAYHIVGTATIDPEATANMTGPDKLIIRKKSNMFVTAGTEKQILTSLKSKCLIWFWIGAALTVISLKAILS